MSLWTIWGPSVRVAVILSPCCSQGGDQNSFKIVCKHYHCPILLSATQWANKSKSQVFTCLPSRNSNPSRYKHYQWFSRKKLCFSPSQIFQKYCIYHHLKCFRSVVFINLNSGGEFGNSSPRDQVDQQNPVNLQSERKRTKKELKILSA